jgi:DNA invertase Pin-like site-specific DNA recombinase
VSRQTYLTRAKKRFLEGTSYRVPVEAVTRGRRTLDQWASILEEERELEENRIRAHIIAGRRSGKRHRKSPLSLKE